uniref:Bm13097, isoform b n=1 Tax=Brugia malayi TaxID=6279 RepID=A0A1I9G285_BRUMA|nr:Bm13097, isoform b [Brugia malayi]
MKQIKLIIKSINDSINFYKSIYLPDLLLSLLLLLMLMLMLLLLLLMLLLFVLHIDDFSGARDDKAILVMKHENRTSISRSYFALIYYLHFAK